MKQLTADIDLDQEVAALAQFINLKWTPIANIRELFTEIREAAFHAARGWIDHHAVWETAVELSDAREAHLEQLLGEDAKGSMPGYYDAVCIFLREVMSKAKDVRDAALDLDGRWDFSQRVRALQARLDAKFPDLAGARPLGWAELAEGYVDFDGQAEYDPKPDRLLFQGSSVEGTLSGSFTGRVALPYVMYDEVCQGHKASHVLVGSVYAQFLGIAEFLNTLALKQELIAEVGRVKMSAMMFDLPFKLENPLLKVISELDDTHKRSEADWLQANAHRAEFQALTAEEQAKRQAENAAEFDRVLAEVIAKAKSGDDESAARKASKDRLVMLVKAAIND